MPDHIDKYTDKQEAAYARKIAATYKKAAQEVRRQITEFTAKHKAKAAKLLQQVNAGEISMADYQAWLQGQVFIGKQWQDKLDDIVRVYTDADEKARKLMRGTVRDVFTESANYAAYQLEDRLGDAVDFHLYDAKTVDRLMRTNPQMLPEWKINEPKDYKWNAQRVRSTLTRAIIEGKPIPDIADELGQQLATGNAKKMVLFARTAMTGAQNAGRIERLHDTQQMGIRVKKKWLASHDARVRDTHAYLDGQERDVDDDFTVGDMHIAYPGDPTAPPELVYNCRCTMIYVYPEHQAEHQGEKTESYEEWLEEKRRKKENTTEEQTAAETEGDGKRWHTREEYEQARANRETLYREERKQAEQWYDAEIDRILDTEFDGGNFTSQRIAIKRDESLTEEEKERKLQEIEEKREQFIRRRDEVAKERDRMMTAAREKCDATFDPEYEYGKISGTLSLDDQVRAVNPHYFEGVEYQVNCQSCGFGFELRMRGYDVEATGAPMMRGAGAEGNVVYAFGKAEFSFHGDGHENTVAIRDQMLQWGDGARGIVSIDRANGEAGHIMNVAVVDGHFCVIDSQCGLFFSDVESGDQVYGMSMEGERVTSVTLYRTDNKPIKYVPESWVMRKKH